MILLSIIIPIFNVELFIEDCLKSIVSQTYKGPIECILVDDCGTDKSIETAKSFIENYRGPIIFRFIYQDINKGASAARNTGIAAAKGDYIMFIDGDDYISSDCLEILADNLKNNNFDLICCDFKVVGGHMDWWSDEYHLYDFESTDQHEIIKYFSSGKLYEMPWNKLIKRQFLIDNQLFFKEGIHAEDFLWSFLLINRLSSFKAISKVTYYYRFNDSSTMNNTKNVTKLIQSRVIIQEILDQTWKEGKILPYKENVFCMRKFKNFAGKDIIRCKSFSWFTKISLLFRLARLSGGHHFIYALIR